MAANPFKGILTITTHSEGNQTFFFQFKEAREKHSSNDEEYKTLPNSRPRNWTNNFFKYLREFQVSWRNMKCDLHKYFKLKSEIPVLVPSPRSHLSRIQLRPYLSRKTANAQNQSVIRRVSVSYQRGGRIKRGNSQCLQTLSAIRLKFILLVPDR